MWSKLIFDLVNELQLLLHGSVCMTDVRKPSGNDRTTAKQTQQHSTCNLLTALLLVPLIFMIIRIMSALFTFALYSGVLCAEASLISQSDIRHQGNGNYQIHPIEMRILVRI